MTAPQHRRPERDAHQRPGLSRRLGLPRLRRAVRWGKAGGTGVGWGLVVPAVFAAAGFLFVTSAEASDGTDLRPQRSASLVGLVEQQSERVDRLQQRAGELEDSVDRLTDQVETQKIEPLHARADRLLAAAGMTPVSGPGLQVTLTDAPADTPVPEGYDANVLVVHQQDLQAVVNALWAGGAEGITLQGQRLISTTGIKCVGNTVVLHGVPYSPPYEIRAVGGPVALQSALDASEYVQNYLRYTRAPFKIGWDVELLTDVTLPGYEGAVDLEYAESAASAGRATSPGAAG